MFGGGRRGATLPTRRNSSAARARSSRAASRSSAPSTSSGATSASTPPIRSPRRPPAARRGPTPTSPGPRATHPTLPTTAPTWPQATTRTSSPTATLTTSPAATSRKGTRERSTRPCQCECQWVLPVQDARGPAPGPQRNMVLPPLAPEVALVVSPATGPRQSPRDPLWQEFS